MARRGAGACDGVSGIFLSVPAEETGFLLQSSCEKEHRVLEQVRSWDDPFHSSPGARHISLRDLPVRSGCGICSFRLELYGEELSGSGRRIPDLLSYRGALYYSLWKCALLSGPVRRVYLLFPYPDRKRVCHLFLRLFSNLLQNPAFRKAG